MKKVFSFFKVLLLFGIICGTGCGIGVVSKSQHRGMSEDIDPFMYGDEFEFRGSGESKPGEISPGEQAGKGASGISHVPGPASVEAGRAKQPGTEKIAGPSDEKQAESVIYRVQIGVFEEQKSAEAYAEEARGKVSVNVHVEFEPPFYRVRIGDFKTRKEAEQYVKTIQNYGFRDAFWVMKQVSVP
jgi:cell division septation protein DedD